MMSVTFCGRRCAISNVSHIVPNACPLVPSEFWGPFLEILAVPFARSHSAHRTRLRPYCIRGRLTAVWSWGLSRFRKQCLEDWYFAKSSIHTIPRAIRGHAPKKGDRDVKHFTRKASEKNVPNKNLSGFEESGFQIHFGGVEKKKEKKKTQGATKGGLPHFWGRGRLIALHTWEAAKLSFAEH